MDTLNTASDFTERKVFQEITDAVKNINEFFLMSKRPLEFYVDKTSKHMGMQVVDNNTQQVISLISAEDTIRLDGLLDEASQILFG